MTTPDEWFSCRRKVKYGMETTAKTASAEMALKYNKVLEPYHCDYCEGWHIGRPRTGNLKQYRLPLK